jgi:hypothetical protein
MAIGAVVGAAVLSALLYLLWRRKRQRPKGRLLIAQRKEERLARFSYSNPLLRGKQLPKPPKGSAPMHAKLSFEEFQRKLPGTDIANPLVKGRKGQRS